MIVLSKDESKLLLALKGWEFDDCPINRDARGEITEDHDDYIKRVCAHRCGCRIDQADIWGIYAPLAEKLLTPRELIQAFEYCVVGYHTWTNTPIQALLSALMMTKCREGDDVIIEFNMDGVVSTVELSQKYREENSTMGEED